MAGKKQKTKTYTDYRGQFQSDGVQTPDYYDVEMGFDQPYMNKDYSDYYGYPYETTEYFPTEKTPQRDILEHSSKNGVNRQVISSYVGDKSKNFLEGPTVPVTKSDTTYIIPSSMGGFLSSGNPDDANSVQYKVLRDKYNGAPGGLQGQTYFSQGYARGGHITKAASGEKLRSTYSDWTPVQNPEAQTPAEGYGGEEAGGYNAYPAEGYGGERAATENEYPYSAQQRAQLQSQPFDDSYGGVRHKTVNEGVTVSSPQQPAGPEGYKRRMQVAPKRQGYAKGGYLKKFEKPAGKLKHDYDGYPVTDSTREGGYITTNLQPQNGEDYYTITEPDDLSANFYKEESKRNNIERLILHPADGYTSNDTIYSMPSGPTILKGSPVYQNYADQYNQDTPVSNSKKIITSLGNKVKKFAKRFLPWDRHGGRLPLLKRQGGRIINVYY